MQAGWRLYPNAERHLRARAHLTRCIRRRCWRRRCRSPNAAASHCRELHYEYPPELVPAGETAASHLAAQLTEQGARWRWPRGRAAGRADAIEHELALIAELRYEHFFLTVHDIVDFARRRASCARAAARPPIPRLLCARHHRDRSGAHALLFERFICRERNEPPDIDVDFEHERREEVMQYIYSKYGRERAALAATVICYRTRARCATSAARSACSRARARG